MVKAIIFDLDGVVVDTERSVWLTSSTQLIASYNKEYHEKDAGHLMYGASFREATFIMYEFYDIQDTFENFLEKRRQLVSKGFAENVRLMEGFEKFYKRLDGRKTAIATSMPEEFLSLTLGHIPLKTLFKEHIYTIAESGGRSKPHPDIFLYAAKKLGQDPSACIVIEDAPRGIEAAKNAGMKVIGLATSVDPEKLSKADCIVNSFAEITDEMLS